MIQHLFRVVKSHRDFRSLLHSQQGNVPFSSYQQLPSLLSLLSTSRHGVTAAMGGRRLLVGVAPDRKQLTAVQEVDNKGQTEPRA